MTLADAGRAQLVNMVLLALAALGLAGGLLARLLDAPEAARLLLLAGAVPVLLAVLADSLASLWRREVGLDLIALVSIAGAIVLDELVVAGVIALMLAGGRALEDYAQARAAHSMTLLLGRVPRTANRVRDGAIVEVPLAEVEPADTLLVRPGEAVPTDGVVLEPEAVLDESALTGEALPVVRMPGQAVRSGGINAGGAFRMRATTRAEASTLAGIVRLVAAARESRAPAMRLADRAAFVFTPLALGVAGAAWAFTGDPLRGLAVIVVATPCPLILGVPVAIVSGMSRCAARGVLVKGGAALERLSRVKTLFLDKTGTITLGQARLVGIETASGVAAEELLRLAASLDQMSQHVIAASLVQAARAQGLVLSMPQQVEETPGAGVTGVLDGRVVSVGSHAYVAARSGADGWDPRALRRMAQDGVSASFVAADGVMLGALLLADEIRTDSPRALRLLRRAGITRIVMLTGDRQDVADAIGGALGLDAVRAELTPEAKLAIVREARAQAPAAMVGDGVNDAPALAAADVGVAMGARGAGASAEAADVVLLVDRLDRLAEALAIARATRRVAWQTVGIGMGLSGLCMVLAAAGLLSPVAGALAQEAIDLAAILNALRVLRAPVPGRPAAPLPAAEVGRLHAEHAKLEAALGQLRATADGLQGLPGARALDMLRAVQALVQDRLLRHELEDGAGLYPRIEKALGGDDPIGALHRSHREITIMAARLARMVDDLGAAPPEGELDAATTHAFQRLLYGLEAILRLHFAQEDELYQSLAEAGPTHASGRG